MLCAYPVTITTSKMICLPTYMAENKNTLSHPPKVMGTSPPIRKCCLYLKKMLVCRGMLKSPLMARSMDLKRSSAPPSVMLIMMSEYCNRHMKLLTDI